jgi:outer membrane protein
MIAMKKINRLVLCLILMQASTGHTEDLLTIYQQALEADPQLKTAAMKVQIGTAQKGQSLGALLPQISGNANWSLNNQKTNLSGPSASKNYHGARYTVSLTQTVLDFAKFWDWRRAQEVEDQYALENISAQHELMYKVVEKYFNVLEAQDQLYFIESEQEATLKQLEQVQKQYAKQLILVTDIYEVEARLDQIKASVIEAETQLVIAKESLKELTNSEPVGLFKLRDTIDFKPLEGKLEDWIAVAKSENPLLAAQIKAIAAASDNVAVQKSRYLPVVDMQLSYNSTNTGYQSISLGTSYDTQVAAINVSVPLFTGGTTTNRMYEAQYRLSISQYENDSKIRALIKETSDSFLSSNASVKRIKATQKALESTIKARESLETGFRYGNQTIGDVIIAQQNEFKAKRDLSVAKYTYIKNKTRFLQSTGLITDTNMQEVNDWLQVGS